MIKTRLIGQVPSSKKYIALTVLAQWIRLCANIVMMFIFSHIRELILGGATMTVSVLLPYIIGISAVMTVRYVCGVCSSKTSFLASAQVKKVLRGKMYKKLTRMGASYHEKFQPPRCSRFLSRVSISLSFISENICRSSSLPCLRR